MKATGLSTWQGSWKGGTGIISTTSDTFKEKYYSFQSRFEGSPGASPEELLAAAHAACYNQALANNFGMIGFEAEEIKTTVAVDLGYGPDKHPAILGISIACEARVANITQSQFDNCTERARSYCTISRILKIDPTLNATLSQ